MTFAHVVVAVGLVMLVGGGLSLAVLIGRAIAMADRREGTRDDD